MGTIIQNPYPAVIDKAAPGFTDVYVKNGTYHFMGCSILSVNMALGFNSTASSLSITLVEDLAKGDAFVGPEIPSLWAFSLPRGGVGAPIFYNDGANFSQKFFDDPAVPFYFAGICTTWRVVTRSTSARTIAVTIVDPKEILNGVQCLLNSFSLSQNIGAGAPRFTSVDNVIDVFGFYNYGMESGRNEFGMKWPDIINAIMACKVRLYDMFFEFSFTGGPFNNTPDFYRLNDDIIDLVSLCGKCSQDAGADFICVTKKVASNIALVEFQSIPRTQTDILTKQEINNFILAREDIVESANIGKEFRNEPNSNVIIGGFRNANYVAYPSEYDQDMHLSVDPNDGKLKENYNNFPSDIKVRLFGGTATQTVDDSSGNPLTTQQVNYKIKSGGIFPYWGSAPGDWSIPLIEPVLFLEHMFFDRNSDDFANITGKIPLVKISTKNYTVRQVPHGEMFLDGDGLSDSRPFAYLENYIFLDSKPDGYFRGLPLNTEILRAALNTGQGNEYFFWSLYGMYYPDVAKSLQLPVFDSDRFLTWATNVHGWPGGVHVENVDIQTALGKNPLVDSAAMAALGARKDKNSQRIAQGTTLSGILRKFQEEIFAQIKQYAEDYLGKQFLICLPRSEIMQRIFNGESVPTRIAKPEIEYSIDNYGYWEKVPTAFDGLVRGRTDAQPGYLVDTTTGMYYSSEEDSIRRRFMGEDGRFTAMAVMNWHPTGNVNFNSNGVNKAMFQDLTPDSYRPNHIAQGNPERVYIGCSVQQLVKRPDLAIISIPPVKFDPTDSLFLDGHTTNLDGTWNIGGDDEFLFSFSGLIKYFWFLKKKDDKFRQALKLCQVGTDFNSFCSMVFRKWARSLIALLPNPWWGSLSTENVMDLESVIIPLNSRWATYGPWYATYAQANGSVKIQTDESLVPWNFQRPANTDSWDLNLNNAGEERLAQTISDISYLDSASITCAGFPEFGPASNFGFNSNLTTISVDFGIGGVKTSYNFSTYAHRPGIFRKADYDNIARTRIDYRMPLKDPLNIKLDYAESVYGTNRFRE